MQSELIRGEKVWPQREHNQQNTAGISNESLRVTNEAPIILRNNEQSHLPLGQHNLPQMKDFSALFKVSKKYKCQNLWQRSVIKKLREKRQYASISILIKSCNQN